MKIFKTKKLIVTVVTAFVLLTSLPFLQSCSNTDEPAMETNSLSKSEGFLSISNIMNRNSFTNDEKTIFNEAQIRIVANLKRNENGFLSLEHTTASELNMDENLFNIFAELYKYAKVSGSVLNQSKNIRANTRMKVSSEINPLLPPLAFNPCEAAYTIISTQLNSTEQKYFDNYWTSKGDMILSQTDVKSIVNAVGRVVKSSTSVTIGGTNYIAKEVNYYGTEYKYAFGTATEYYNAAGTCVGFKDIYDFNAAARDGDNETITQSVGAVGTLCGATNYIITYGLHQ